MSRVETYQLYFGPVHVVRDDLIVGGTKARVAATWLVEAAPTATELVYAGPSTGFAPIALALAAAYLGRKLRLYLIGPPTGGTRWLATQAHVALMMRNCSMTKLFAEADKYTAARPDCWRVPFGLADPRFRELLAASISADYATLPVRRIWVAAGSATLAAALQTVWPAAQVIAVQVGRDVTAELAPGIARYVAPQRFGEATAMLPPYPSVATYDAKVWEQVLTYGEAGDYIWNVAADM